MNVTGAADTLWFLDTLIRIRVAGDSHADGISVLEHLAPQGSSPPLHVHRTEDEIFHVLEGDLRLRVDGADLHARAGDTLLAPKGKPHSFLVTSMGGARWLTLTNHGDFERMVRQAGRPAEANALPPSSGAPSPAQAEALAAICRANHIDLIGAPLSLG